MSAAQADWNDTAGRDDASRSGAAVATDQRPPIGALVTLGKVQGRVVRHLEEGFAIEFTRLQHSDFVEENVTGG